MELLHINSNELSTLVMDCLGGIYGERWVAIDDGLTAPFDGPTEEIVYGGSHLWRAFGARKGGEPVGIIAFDDVDYRLKAATLGALIVDGHYARPHYTVDAAMRMLEWGFGQLCFEVVNAWSLESNVAWMNVLRRLNFHSIGRERNSVRAQGGFHDRLWFELLRSGHKESTHEQL